MYDDNNLKVLQRINIATIQGSNDVKHEPVLHHIHLYV
jgi:hypothetical protein